MATDDYSSTPKGWSIHPGTLRPTWRNPNPEIVEDEDEKEPEGMSFEDLMALKYPLIDREYPFHE